jgi:predicted TIM-barrel fold metal-dependent hydrolase
LRRRDFFKAGAFSITAAISEKLPGQQFDSIPIIDAHIHLFDPTRPGGVPWPEKSDSVLYKPALPRRYRQVTEGLGVRGAIAVECSPLESDNDWLLQTAASDPVMVGVIGDLVPGSASFQKDLERLAENSLFRGIRYGNLWNHNLLMDLEKPGFIDGLKAMASARLVLESANPDGDLIAALVRVKERVPELRIVADHLPNAVVPKDAAGKEEYRKNLERLAQSPDVFIKLSEIPMQIHGKIELNPAFYRSKLDDLWGIFGENRVIFGSDWPNSDHLVDYRTTFGLVKSYMATKSSEAQEKYFWRNSIAAYKWDPRSREQPIF